MRRSIKAARHVGVSHVASTTFSIEPTMLSTWTEHEFLFVIRLSHRRCRWDGVKDVRAFQHLETRSSLSKDRDLGIPGFSNPEDARNDQDDPLGAGHKVTQSAFGKM
jgi:hypothetical protein